MEEESRMEREVSVEEGERERERGGGGGGGVEGVYVGEKVGRVGVGGDVDSERRSMS